MEDQSKYLKRSKFDGMSEIFRVYYNPSLISFELFIWIEQYTIIQSILNEWYIFKAYPTNSIGTTLICRN